MLVDLEMCAEHSSHLSVMKEREATLRVSA